MRIEDIDWKVDADGELMIDMDTGDYTFVNIDHVREMAEKFGYFLTPIGEQQSIKPTENPVDNHTDRNEWDYRE